jgi:hypothetical protein
MSDRKKKVSPTLRNIYKKQHGARPCVEKMQLNFFVPPNEELEIAPPVNFIYCTSHLQPNIAGQDSNTT